MRVLELIVPPELDGHTVKQLIHARFHLSHHALTRLKALRGIWLDGAPVQVNVRAAQGQRLELRLHDEDRELPPPIAQPIPIVCVYEDADLLIVDKPAPLAAQGSERQPMDTLANAVAYRYRDEPDFIYRPVHRLDKGTSGLMVIARNAHAQQRLQARLHTPDFTRGYLAVVVGRPQPERGMINAPIGKAQGQTIRREIQAEGKPAVTHYETLRSAGNHSLISLRLETGRTHQIRVHMQSMGCPVAGDFLYGQEDVRLPRRFALHAQRLHCLHPVTDAVIDLTSPMPACFEALLHTTTI